MNLFADLIAAQDDARRSFAARLAAPPAEPEAGTGDAVTAGTEPAPVPAVNPDAIRQGWMGTQPRSGVDAFTEELRWAMAVAADLR